jgi:hypothetical protein
VIDSTNKGEIEVAAPRSLSGVLNQLQVVPGWQDFSLKGVAELVFEVYYAVSKHLMAALREDAFVALVIAGHAKTADCCGDDFAGCGRTLDRMSREA